MRYTRKLTTSATIRSQTTDTAALKIFTNQAVSHASLISTPSSSLGRPTRDRRQIDVKFFLLQLNVYEKSERCNIGKALP